MIEFALLAIVSGMGSNALTSKRAGTWAATTLDKVAFAIALGLAGLSALFFLLAVGTAPWGSIR